MIFKPYICQNYQNKSHKIQSSLFFGFLANYCHKRSHSKAEKSKERNMSQRGVWQMLFYPFRLLCDICRRQAKNRVKV